MLLIDSNGNYPRYIGDLQLEHPTYKDGDSLPEGWIEVVETSAPEHSENEIALQGEPTLVDGVMTMTWTVRNLTPSELERKNAPSTVKEKLIALGFNESEIFALSKGLVR